MRMDERIIDFFSQRLDGPSRRELLRDMAADETLRSDFIRYRNLSGLATLTGQPGDEAIGRENYARFMAVKTRRVRQPALFRVLGYAAAVALLIVGAWSAGQWFGAGPANEQPVAHNTLRVPAGQRASLTLSDGTEVWLNANSTLTYPARFGNGAREVSISGEAFFTVAKDKDHPFVVSTSSVSIVVLGTVFNVADNREAGATQVSLLEGQIEVELPDGNTDRIRMEPDQLLHYEGGVATVTQGIDGQEFLWREGIIQFRELPLSAIAQQLSQYYGVRISIANERLAARTYTGKFRLQDGVAEILRIIQQAQKFSLKKDETHNSYWIR